MTRAVLLLLAVGVAALAATLAGALLNPALGLRSYLYAWLFWLGLALGSLAISMVQRLTGGDWGLLIRRPLEAAALTLPLLLLLGIPMFFNLHDLFVWSNPQAIAGDEIIRHKHLYLNIPFFTARYIIYFLIWITLSLLLCRWSLRYDHGELELRIPIQKLCAAGLIIYILTMTFASIDWIMSREPHYYSTVFGFIVVVGQATAGLSFAIVTLTILRPSPLQSRQLIDLGSLLFTCIILFTYMALAQFLINWIGNAQEEITWYVQRTAGGWGLLALAIFIFHFFIPFFLLLSRDLKQKLPALAVIAVLVLIMRLFHDFWMVAPSGYASHPGFNIYWTDFTAPIGIGGIWLATFIWIVNRRPLIVPQMQEGPETFGHGHTNPNIA